MRAHLPGTPPQPLTPRPSCSTPTQGAPRLLLTHPAAGVPLRVVAAQHLTLRRDYPLSAMGRSGFQHPKLTSSSLPQLPPHFEVRTQKRCPSLSCLPVAQLPLYVHACPTAGRSAGAAARHPMHLPAAASAC